MVAVEDVGAVEVVGVREREGERKEGSTISSTCVKMMECLSHTPTCCLPLKVVEITVLNLVYCSAEVRHCCCSMCIRYIVQMLFVLM